MGFTVVEATDRQEALAKFAEQRFNLVMLDVLMPIIDGFKVCKEIQKRSDVPIVMITALNRPEDVIRGLELSADNYITKLFNFRELQARIHAVMRRSLHLSTYFPLRSWRSGTQSCSTMPRRSKSMAGALR